MKRSVCLALWGGLLVADPASAGQQDVEIVDRTFQVAGTPEIVVRSVDGSVTVRAHRDPQVVVRAVTEVYRADNDEEARAAAARLMVEMRQLGDRVELTVERVRPAFIEDRLLSAIGMAPYAVVRFEIATPAASDLDLRTDDGAIDVTGLDGRLQLASDDGDVSVRSSTGAIEVRADDGDVRLDDVGGSVRVRNDDGDIQLSGELRVVRLATDDGDIRLGVLPGSRMDEAWSVQSDDGHINVTLPEGFAADLEVRFDDGEVTTDVPIAIDRRSERRLSGRIDGGGLRFDIRSDDGDVRIER